MTNIPQSLLMNGYNRCGNPPPNQPTAAFYTVSEVYDAYFNNVDNGNLQNVQIANITNPTVAHINDVTITGDETGGKGKLNIDYAVGNYTKDVTIQVVYYDPVAGLVKLVKNGYDGGSGSVTFSVPAVKSSGNITLFYYKQAGGL